MKLNKLCLIALFFVSNVFSFPSSGAILKKYAYFCASFLAYRICKIVYNKYLRNFSEKDMITIRNTKNLRERHTLMKKLYLSTLARLTSTVTVETEQQFNILLENYLKDNKAGVNLEDAKKASKIIGGPAGAVYLSETDMVILGLQEGHTIDCQYLYDKLHDLLFKDLPIIDEANSTSISQNPFILATFKKIKIDYENAKNEWKKFCWVPEVFPLSLYKNLSVAATSAQKMFFISQFAVEEAEWRHESLLWAYDQKNNTFSREQYARLFLENIEASTIFFLAWTLFRGGKMPSWV